MVTLNYFKPANKVSWSKIKFLLDKLKSFGHNLQKNSLSNGVSNFNFE